MAESMDQFLRAQEKALKRGDLEMVLSGIKQLFTELGASHDMHGQHIGTPLFDALCQKAGQLSTFELLGKVGQLPEQAHHIIVVTEIVCQGGHAELVRDIIRTSKLPVLLVASNINQRKEPVLQSILDEPNLLGLITPDATTLLESLRTIQCVLANPLAGSIFLLTHGYDSAVTAAIDPQSGKEILYLHHCDHYPALGCYLAGARHIDLHNVGFLRCRNEFNLAENRYLCMSAKNLAQTRKEWRFATPCLKTASCGGSHKLHTLPYHIDYKDMVIEILKSRNGVHFHIGKLTDSCLTAMYNALAHAKLDEEQFIYLGEAPNLATILTELEIDLYVPTLPQSGGKAVIDVMAAGIPILAHQNARDRIFGSTDLIYPEAPSWSTFTQLRAILANYDKDLWHAQSRAARDYFERFHTESMFIEQLGQGGVNLESGLIPGLKSWLPEIDRRLHYSRFQH